MRRILFLLLVVLVAAVGLSAQTAMTQTVLGQAVANVTDTQIKVAASTGFAVGSIAFVDKEAMEITAINTTTLWMQVARGRRGTKPAKHLVGSVVYVGTPDKFGTSDPEGSCTATSEKVLPLIIPSTGHIAWCTDSHWAVYDPGVYAAAPQYCTVPVGSVAYGSFGTATTLVNGTAYTSSIELPGTKVITGIKVLQAGTVGADKLIAYLYTERGGAPIANSALAGVTTSGANTFLALPFTAPIVVPPGRYMLSAHGNGTTDNVRTIATVTFVDLLTKSATGTFGTAPSLTVPTGFTQDVGIIACVY